MIRQLALLLALTISCSSCRCIDVPPDEGTLTIVTSCEFSSRFRETRGGVARDGDFVLYSTDPQSSLGDGRDDYTSWTFEVCSNHLRTVRERGYRLEKVVIDLDVELSDETNPHVDVLSTDKLRSFELELMPGEESGLKTFSVVLTDGVSKTVLEAFIERFAQLTMAYHDDGRVRRAEMTLVYEASGKVLQSVAPVCGMPASGTPPGSPDR